MVISNFNVKEEQVMRTWMPGLIMILIGILVLVWPDLIRWFVGIGIIVVGVLMLMGRGQD